MIITKKDLKEYIKKDRARYVLRPSLFHYYFSGDETFATLLFLRRLRKTEYYMNNMKKSNLISVIRFAFSFFLYRRLQLHFKLFIPLNVVGPGLYIPHRMGGIIINALQIGRDFTINAGCIIGKKNDNFNRPTIGDNVEMCVGSKIIGKVFIGNNVIVAPNSVVIKDIEKNCIVSGIPARTIKIRQI